MDLEYTRVTQDEGEVGKILLRDFMPPTRKGYIRVGPDKVCVPEHYLKFAESLTNLEVRDDDVWVVSHPKTGTTWTQEMAWCIANNLDFEKAKQLLTDRFPFVDVTILLDFSDILAKDPGMEMPLCVANSVQFVNELSSPRFIKTHLPWSMLPKQIQEGTKHPKMIYICRNAKDTCLSYFHHCVLLEGFQGSLEDFCKLFIGDSVAYNPFWSHVLGFWKRRHQSNILFLKYEDMKKDLPAVIRVTAKFLNKSLTEDQVNILKNHLSFESMKNNEAVNYDHLVAMSKSMGFTKGEGTFMRSGAVGEGKEKMTSEMINKFEQWTKKNLKGSDLVI